jgi:hypothetical protein
MLERADREGFGASIHTGETARAPDSEGRYDDPLLTLTLFKHACKLSLFHTYSAVRRSPITSYLKLNETYSMIYADTRHSP